MKRQIVCLIITPYTFKIAVHNRFAQINTRPTNQQIKQIITILSQEEP